MFAEVVYITTLLLLPRLTWGSRSCSDFLGHTNCRLLPKDEACGNSTLQINERIMGGKETLPSEYPWVVQLYHRKDHMLHKIFHFFGWRRDKWFFSCGASLITRYYILTSAHCCTKSQIYMARLGQYDRKSVQDTFQDILVETFLIHPKHDKPKGHNDIALLRLQTPVILDSNVNPICLPISPVIQSGEFENLPFEAAGFGVYKIRGNKYYYPHIMHKVTLKMIPIAECSAIYYNSHKLIVGVKQLCTSSEGGVDTCNGDSGGPLMTAVKDNRGHPRYFLTGVVSFGDNMCGHGLPCVYSKVSEYLEWILDSMKP